MASLVPRDDSGTRIDLAADRLAYLTVSYALLLSIAYRSFARGEAAWDLLAVLILSGFVGLGYRLSKGAVSGRGTILTAATVSIAIIVSGLVVIAGR